jgi:outer membrane receptor protein involved in Fe transport
VIPRAPLDAGGGPCARRRHFRRRGWAGAALAALLIAGPATAGTTGRIAGRVVDAKKQPLPGVTVAMVGLKLGALTDEDGRFSIVNIPAGSYNVRANLIGYRPVTTTNLLVSADETTRLDLVLEEAPVQMEEVVVSAKRPVVEVNRTSTVAIVPREEIQKLPVQELQDVVNLQAGVVDGHFRGGRQNEVQYQVDGVSTNNAYDNTNTVRIDRSLLEEVQVVSGTFDAEYGQAMSGVVNAVLRRGGERFEWDSEALLGMYAYSGDNRGQSYEWFPGSKQDYQFTMSGPAGLPRTTFLANASYHVHDGAYWAERRFTPQPTPSRDPVEKMIAPDGDGTLMPLKGASEWAGILKLSNRSLEGREFAYQILVNAIEGQDRPWNLNLVPDAAKTQRTLSVVHGLSFTHTLSPKRYYQVDLRQNYYDYRDMAFDDVNDVRYHLYGPLTGVSGYEFGNPVQGVDFGRFQLTTNAFVGKGTYVDQISNTHQLKMGLEYQAPLMKFGAPGEIFLGVIPARARSAPSSPTSRAPNTCPCSSRATRRTSASGTTSRSAWVADSTGSTPGPTCRATSRTPRTAFPACRNPRWCPRPTSSRCRRASACRIRSRTTPPSTSPTAHFYQYPPLRDMFNNSDYSVLADLQAADDIQRNGILGNPDLKSQRTVQYQIGLKNAITPDLGLDFNAFYKDIRDLLGVEFLSTYNGAQYVRWTNVDYGDVVGLTVQLDHRAFGPFSLSADYTWQQALGNSSDPDETLNRAAAGQDPLPRQIPFNWDQTHTFNVTLATGVPSGWQGSTILRYSSGQPYTPTLDNSSPQLQNTGRKPSSLVCDLKVERPARFARETATLFLRVFNVFDARYLNGYVFPSSGSPDYTRFPGDEGQASILDDPTRYYAPRRIELGVTLRQGTR